MARWFHNRPSEKCGETEIKVANKLRRLSKRWTIRWGFYYVDNKGIRREEPARRPGLHTPSPHRYSKSGGRY